jgi:hypothetical protein
MRGHSNHYASGAGASSEAPVRLTKGEPNNMKRICTIAALALSALLLMASASSAAVVTTINDANAPSGTHVANNSADPTCTVNADLDVNCNAYVLGGVGNTNATATLVADYSATIDCNNPGNNRNNPIESHTADFEASESMPVFPSRNGQLRVGALSVSAFDAPQVCPNDRWIPEIRDGTLVLEEFTYTLTFAGFTDPYIKITGP